MINNINVFSRYQMKSLRHRIGVNDLIISINDPAVGIYGVDEGPLFEESSPKILTLFFHDLDGDSGFFGDKAVLFDETHADSIAEFIKYWHRKRGDYTLHVHCFMGISRSGAVGRVASEYLGINKQFEMAHRQIQPNVRVMNYLRPRLGLTYRGIRNVT